MDDAFETYLEVQNHQILLLDDVMTTGSTLNAAARCRKEVGASSVGAIVLSRKCGTHLKMDFLMPETQKIRTDRSSKMVYRDLQLRLVFQQIFWIAFPIEYNVPDSLKNQKSSFGILLNY